MSESTSGSASAEMAALAPHSVHPGREAIDGSVRILKQGETFAVFDRFGDASATGLSSHGLYHEGTRHLSMLAFQLAGARPLVLKSTITADNLVLAVDLTNPDRIEDLGLIADTIHVFRGKTVRDGALHEKVRLTNHGLEAVTFPLTWRFGADFADIFEVRGSVRARRGRRLAPEIRGDGVTLAYLGLDGVTRRTTLVAAPRPAHVTAHDIQFEITLAPKEEVCLELEVLCEGESPSRPVPVGFDQACRAIATARHRRGPHITSGNPMFDRWLTRSISDLAMMVTETSSGPYPYAGIPWYNCVFGRDGLLTASSMLWTDPGVARGVLGFLAATQATHDDDTRDAEPGKIVHEIRHGEMAATGEVPFGRYYGSIDSTPLFVMLGGAYLRRTADVATIARLWPSFERALRWIEREGDRDQDGFLEYGRRSANGLVQQGWKDSHDSVFHADGGLAVGPIAVCEVQGYAYAARLAGAQMARALGDTARADELERAAARLRTRFDDAFWSDAIGSYALALDGEKRRCEVMSSNPGHTLWTGIVSDARAAQIGAALLDREMFNGWGVRTLARTERRYNPMSYHNGSGWPHDTAICAAGLARYGMKHEAVALFSGLFDASAFMELHRLPELMCGFGRKPDQGPILYPVACSPQAWSSAAVLQMLEACLGLDIDAAARRVRFHEPRLPDWLPWLQIDDLEVADGAVSVRITVEGVELLSARGDVAISS
jgi:glycogen debranching enzyme